MVGRLPERLGVAVCFLQCCQGVNIALPTLRPVFEAVGPSSRPKLWPCPPVVGGRVWAKFSGRGCFEARENGRRDFSLPIVSPASGNHLYRSGTYFFLCYFVVNRGPTCFQDLGHILLFRHEVLKRFLAIFPLFRH